MNSRWSSAPYKPDQYKGYYGPSDSLVERFVLLIRLEKPAEAVKEFLAGRPSDAQLIAAAHVLLKVDPSRDMTDIFARYATAVLHLGVLKSVDPSLAISLRTRFKKPNDPEAYLADWKHPGGPDERIVIIECMIRWGRFETAREWINSLDDAGSSEAVFLQGWLHYIEGDYLQSINILTNIKDEPEAALIFADAVTRLNDSGLEDKALRSLLRVPRTFWQLWPILARLYFKKHLYLHGLIAIYSGCIWGLRWSKPRREFERALLVRTKQFALTGTPLK